MEEISQKTSIRPFEAGSEKRCRYNVLYREREFFCGEVKVRIRCGLKVFVCAALRALKIQTRTHTPVTHTDGREGRSVGSSEWVR